MKVVLYMAMTLNGYIARENDETPWSKEIWKSYYKIAKGYKALILGRRTFDIMKEVDEFRKIGNPFTVIVTGQEIDVEKNFISVKSPKDAMKLLKARKFQRILLGGGGKINGSFMKEGLVNEIILDIQPIVFGKGIKLFSDNDFEARLRLIKMRKLPSGIIQLHYAVKSRLQINHP
jgi:dihydrofolate reductase